MTFALYGLSLTACSGCGLAVFGAATVGRASDAQADPLATALCGIITVGFGLATGFWAKETWLGLLDDAVDVGRGTGADGRPPPAGPR